MNKLPISVCLIVLNERDRLEACLTALQGRFAEILVYDNGSSDGTVQYLRSLEEVTLIEGPWLGFSQTRRALWRCARQPWILWLDADEILSQEVLNDLSRVGLEPSIAGYRFNRQILFGAKRIRHGEWFPDWTLRVFGADSWHMAERAVHESVEVSGPVANLKGVVDHYSFRSWEDLRRRSERYTQLWVQQACAQHRRPESAVFHAVWRFFRGYILKWGWLDGWLGYKIALHNATEVYNKYTQLKRAYRNSAVGKL